MNDSEARQIVGRLTSCFPAARLGADNVAAYIAWIRKHDWDTAEAAVVQLVGTMKRWPTLADFDEACREVHASRPPRHRALPPPTCGMCEDGWLTLDDAGRTTVTRCPNGCVPNAIAKENASRHEAPMTAAELERNKARLAELMETLRKASAIPKPSLVAGAPFRRSRGSGRRFSIDPESGHAELVGRERKDLE